MIMKLSRIVILILILLMTLVVIWYFFPEKKLDTSRFIDKMVIHKEKRKLGVYSEGELLKTYKISLGSEPEGRKQFEGDGKTPEGVYLINDKNPKSGYFLNLGISYPNKKDIKYARMENRNPGGAIKIHGLKNGMAFIGKFHLFFDWTQGCVAVTNAEMQELYDNINIGTKIEIKK